MPRISSSSLLCQTCAFIASTETLSSRHKVNSNGLEIRSVVSWVDPAQLVSHDLRCTKANLCQSWCFARGLCQLDTLDRSNRIVAEVCAYLWPPFSINTITVGRSVDPQIVTNGTSLRTKFPSIGIVAVPSRSPGQKLVRAALCVGEDSNVSRREGRQGGCDKDRGAPHDDDVMLCSRSQYKIFLGEFDDGYLAALTLLM
jgi:hypothetical protein